MKLVGLSTILGLTQAAGWTHSEADQKDATKWKDACQTGKAQTPIALYSASSAAGFTHSTSADPLNAFAAYGQHSGKKHAGKVQKGAGTHGFKFTFDNQLILGNGYACSQWHCHFKSEHTIDEKYTAGECHLVCHKQSIAENLGAPHLESTDNDALRVFGIMIKEGAAGTADNAAFEEIINNYAIASDAGTASSVTLPDPEATSLWRYFGSLTTPNCQEIVHWTVFDGGLTISPAQALKIQAFADGNDRNNYRMLQERNDRPVTVYKYNAKNTVSTSSAGQVGFGILVALVGMLF